MGYSLTDKIRILGFCEGFMCAYIDTCAQFGILVESKEIKEELFESLQDYKVVKNHNGKLPEKINDNVNYFLEQILMRFKEGKIDENLPLSFYLEKT